MPPLPELVELSDAVAGVSGPESAAVYDSARRCMIDALATIVLGCTDPVVRCLAASMPVSGNGVRIIGSARRVAAADAVLVHATAAHAYDIGDGIADAGLHPGQVVVPVALAVAEQVDAAPRDVLGAITGGYELMARFGRAVHPELSLAGLCPSGIVGAAAAAYVASRLRGLDRQQTLDAIGTAVMIAPTATFERADTRAVHSGAAAAAGMRATDLASAGFHGGRGVLDGDRGIGHLVGVPVEVLRERALAELRPAVQRAYFKPFAACRHSHGAIELALQLRGLLDVADIVGIEVGTYRVAAELVAHRARAGEGWSRRDTSLPFAMAVALQHGRCGPEEMARAANLASVYALAERITVTADPQLDVGYPCRLATRVTARTADGRGVTLALDHRLGDPERPLPDGALGDRFETWAVGSGIPAADARAALGLARDFGVNDQSGGAEQLTRLLVCQQPSAAESGEPAAVSR